jgi:hypothetical protein
VRNLTGNIVEEIVTYGKMQKEQVEWVKTGGRGQNGIINLVYRATGERKRLSWKGDFRNGVRH